MSFQSTSCQFCRVVLILLNKWWKDYEINFPALSRFPSERVFSCSGNIVTCHRTSLRQVSFPCTKSVNCREAGMVLLFVLLGFCSFVIWDVHKEIQYVSMFYLKFAQRRNALSVYMIVELAQRDWLKSLYFIICNRIGGLLLLLKCNSIFEFLSCRIGTSFVLFYSRSILFHKCFVFIWYILILCRVISVNKGAIWHVA